ncbi:MAG TPA: hypothetical protein VFF73_06295 [Planctomycetota bacterium]|nr:hypothetical protein [Planctomycetota bacterium]
MRSSRVWVIVASLLLVLVAISRRWVVEQVAPRLAVAMVADDPFEGKDFAYHGPHLPAYPIPARDPWGHRMLTRELSDHDTIYSVGPNGIDENGAGDDVVPTPLELRIGHWLASAPVWILPLTVFLGWCALGPMTRARRAPSLVTEVGRALVPACVPFAALGLAMWVFGPWRDTLAGLGSLSVVPPEVALLAGVGLVCFVTAIAWRLSRPLEDRPPTSHEAWTLDRAQDG